MLRKTTERGLKIETSAERPEDARSIKRRIRSADGKTADEHAREELEKLDAKGVYAFAKPFPPQGWDLYAYYPPKVWHRKMYGKPRSLRDI